MLRLVLFLLLLSAPGAACAQERSLTLAVDGRLEATGLIAYLVPRFALKFGTRVAILPGGAEEIEAALAQGAADAAIAPAGIVAALRAAELAEVEQPAFYTEDPRNGGAYSVTLRPGAERGEHARQFLDWLLSEVGQRTVATFASVDVTYLPGAIEEEEIEEYIPEGDVREGERLSYLHCGRCHVVSERNRFGGIGSTPSFGALRTIDGWLEKFMNFWALNPHPSFTQVAGITDPFDPTRPPHIAPVEITLAELEAIVAFAASITPKDLGAEVQSR